MHLQVTSKSIGMGLVRANKPIRGPNWCYMAPHGFVRTPIVTKSSLNNSPRVPGVVRDHLKIAFFQPTHAGLKMGKSSPLGPYKGTNLENLGIAPGTPVIA